VRNSNYRRDAEYAEKGKTFDTECTEKNRRTQRKIRAIRPFHKSWARGGSVGRGRDDCGGGWEGGGVIQDDAPAFGKFSEVEGEDAGGLVGFADEVEFSYHVGGVGAGEMNLEIGEGECAHGFAIWIGVVVAIEDCLPAVGYAVRAEKFCLL
jgi:hypothetical protein